MSGKFLDPASTLDQYEILRKEALQPGSAGHRGHGFSLFVSRGMPAWLAALSALTSVVIPQAKQTEAFVRPDCRLELAAVLADMVLACNEEDLR